MGSCERLENVETARLLADALDGESGRYDASVAAALRLLADIADDLRARRG